METHIKGPSGKKPSQLTKKISTKGEKRNHRRLPREGLEKGQRTKEDSKRLQKTTEGWSEVLIGKQGI